MKKQIISYHHNLTSKYSKLVLFFLIAIPAKAIFIISANETIDTDDKNTIYENMHRYSFPYVGLSENDKEKISQPVKDIQKTMLEEQLKDYASRYSGFKIREVPNIIWNIYIAAQAGLSDKYNKNPKHYERTNLYFTTSGSIAKLLDFYGEKLTLNNYKDFIAKVLKPLKEKQPNIYSKFLLLDLNNILDNEPNILYRSLEIEFEALHQNQLVLFRATNGLSYKANTNSKEDIELLDFFVDKSWLTKLSPEEHREDLVNTLDSISYSYDLLDGYLNDGVLAPPGKSGCTYIYFHNTKSKYIYSIVMDKNFLIKEYGSMFQMGYPDDQRIFSEGQKFHPKFLQYRAIAETTTEIDGVKFSKDTAARARKFNQFLGKNMRLLSENGNIVEDNDEAYFRLVENHESADRQFRSNIAPFYSSK